VEIIYDLCLGIDIHDTKKYMMKTRSFARPVRSGTRQPSRFSGSRPGFRKSGFKSRGSRSSSPKRRGDRIDVSRFIKKGEHVEEKQYVPKHTFSDFSFNPQLHKNIAKAGYIHPRPIQDQTIPPILMGKDVFGMANTGTGKTAAFLLPLIEKISKTKGQNKKETVLIMAPTRELAIQIEEEFRSLAFGFGMFSVSCVGGLPINKQIREIKMGVSFVIGTPGRLRDLINQKILDLSNCHSVVLDEADRMLDMGFRDDMLYIIGKTHKERQTLFFSATLSPEIKKITSQYLKDPVFISVVSGETAKSIDQNVVRYKGNEERIEKLHEVLKKDGSDKVLIFREMKHSVDTLAKELTHAGFKVGGIHGDKRSRERIRILDSFKQDKINILIATDVAARGLDIPDVTHVINYDVPQTYDTYIHRIGRTGRAGKKGTALTFVPS
jgi:superfamily II DNA/RNA helicase